MDRTKDYLIIAAIAGTLFFFNLGKAKLWDRDEPRNAGCAKEMMERGNWVTPIFNDELRDAKPALLYWFIISAYQVFGVTEFAARFWSAALALGTVLCTCFIASRLFGRKVGFYSGMILSTSLMFEVAARAATPDSLLIFFSTASLSVFVAFAFPKNGNVASREENISVAEKTGFPNRHSMAVGMYALMALGVLAKGPIGFLMPSAIIGMYLLIVTLKKQSASHDSRGFGRWSGMIVRMIRPFHPIHFVKTCWSMKLVVGAFVILAIAGPWYYMVGQQTNGEFLRTFFLKEHLGRSTTSFENHSGGIFYYPMVMAMGFFPWSIFALPVVVSIYQKRKDISPQLVLLFCWVGVQVSVFTIVQTKLPSYVTPCYPALAMIVGYHLHQWKLGTIGISAWIPRISLATLILSGALLVAGLGFAATQLLDLNPAIAMVGIIPLTGGIVAMIYWSRAASEIPYRSLFTSAIAFSFVFFGWVLPFVSQNQRYEELLVQQERVESNRLLGSFGCLEPTWVFYSGKTVYELVKYESESEASTNRSENWMPKRRPALKTFLVENNGQVITTRELVPQIEAVIDQPVDVVDEVRYFLKKEKLVLIQVKQPKLADVSNRFHPKSEIQTK